MDKKKERLLKDYEHWLWYSRGDIHHKRVLQKELVLKGLAIVPIYMLVLAAIAYVFFLIDKTNNYMNILRVMIAFFFLPCIPGYICALLFPVYEESIALIGYVICLLAWFLQHFCSTETALIISFIIAVIICEKIEPKYRYSKEIEMENLIYKLKSDEK